MFPPPRSSPVIRPARPRSRLVGWLSSLGTIGLLILTLGGKLKFLLPVLKFIGPVLKTGSTMLLSIGVYALVFGWKFAVGFVLSIFVHEMGHVVAAWKCGIKVTAPTFIPFLGAHILLKQALPGAWVEAKIGIGGPLAGALAAGVCHITWLATGNPLWAALADTGYFLNLFNLAPFSPLDGGRIVGAISRWLWLIGVVVIGGWLAWDIALAVRGEAVLGTGVVVMVLILAAGLPRLFTLFRKRTEEEQRYFTVTPGQRLGMSLAYFGLIAALGLGMTGTHQSPEKIKALRSEQAAVAR